MEDPGNQNGTRQDIEVDVEPQLYPLRAMADAAKSFQCGL